MVPRSDASEPYNTIAAIRGLTANVGNAWAIKVEVRGKKYSPS
jgi:hypothetical protein